MKIRFTKRAAADFNYWKDNDPKLIERIRELIKACQENPFEGIGKPERLRHFKNPALYSRRINREHRLVYSVNEGELTVIACRFHYEI
ncbi:Txe/YoeB family addiction module toxin [Pantoea sp. A4]|uniref:Txe/YoeB family addiction module toxin n=1 Tax=Pantoea sp. A4 TaxID=1225184 RepID=UPI0008FAD9A7|nr:Txe/YoeB family addiction module toxin [Pantoea sp. A4]